MAAKIDKEIKNIIDGQYRVALDILKANRDIMDKMVKLLYEKETIYEAEIDALFERKPDGDGGDGDREKNDDCDAATTVATAVTEPATTESAAEPAAKKPRGKAASEKVADAENASDKDADAKNE